MTKQRFMDCVDILKTKGYKFSQWQERLLYEEFGDMDIDKFEKICKESFVPESMNSYDTLKYLMGKLNEEI